MLRSVTVRLAGAFLTMAAVSCATGTSDMGTPDGATGLTPLDADLSEVSLDDTAPDASPSDGTGGDASVAPDDPLDLVDTAVDPMEAGMDDSTGPVDTAVEDTGTAPDVGFVDAPVEIDTSLPVDTGTRPDVHVDARVDTGPSTGAPVCLHVGMAGEGWYAPGGRLLCTDACSGLAAPRCQRVGTTAQGWYSVTGHGCPPYTTLIVHDASCH